MNTSLPLTLENLEKAARLVVAANRVYCNGIEDVIPPDWDDMSPFVKKAMIDAVRARLSDITMPLSVNHDSWMAARLADGWTLGEKKNEEKKIHPNLIPYAELPRQQRIKDLMFVTVVLTFFGVEVPDVKILEA